MGQNDPFPGFPDAAASFYAEAARGPRRAARAAPAGLARASLVLGLLGVGDGLVFLLLWLNRATITGESNRLPAWYFGLALGQGITWYVLGLLALIFGIVSLSLLVKRKAGRHIKTLALTGLALGILHVAVTAVGFILLISSGALLPNG